jgi:hypothetical protein
MEAICSFQMTLFVYKTTVWVLLCFRVNNAGSYNITGSEIQRLPTKAPIYGSDFLSYDHS